MSDEITEHETDSSEPQPEQTEGQDSAVQDNWAPVPHDVLKRIVEGALLAVGEALSIERLLGLFEEHEKPAKADIAVALKALQDEHEGRGYTLEEVASGWRFQVCPDLAPWVNRLWEEKPQKYSRALLETLSLIAYRQPITRGDIEEVRGVAVSSHIIKTLAEREWIKVVGHRDVPGRPSLYATTRQFLDYFGLKSLDELPTLSELKDIDSLNNPLNLDGSEDADEDEQIAQAREDVAEGPDDSIEQDMSADDAQIGQAQAEASLEEDFGRAPDEPGEDEDQDEQPDPNNTGTDDLFDPDADDNSDERKNEL